MSAVTKFSNPVMAPAFLGMMGNPFGITFYVGNTTNPGEDQGSAGTTRQGRSPKNPFATVAAAISEAVSGRGDVIVIQRGTYTENLSVNKAGLTMIGAVPYGYPDHVVITGRTVVSVAGVSFYNLEFFSNSGTYPSLRVGSATDSANTITSLWCENCSFASDGTTEPEAGVLLFGGNNIIFRNCRFVDNTFGINIHQNAGEYPGHIVVEGCEFTEQTTADIADLTGTFDSSLSVPAANGVGINFRVQDCTFNAGGTTPTDFINISSAGTSNGVITNCNFASATHASATITIPSGILYAVNYAEEGPTGAFSGAIGTSGRPD